jgi:hypothetical protein
MIAHAVLMVAALRQSFGGLGIVYGSGGGGWDSEEDGKDGEENVIVELSNYHQSIVSSRHRPAALPHMTRSALSSTCCFDFIRVSSVLVLVLGRAVPQALPPFAARVKLTSFCMPISHIRPLCLGTDPNTIMDDAVRTECVLLGARREINIFSLVDTRPNSRRLHRDQVCLEPSISQSPARSRTFTYLGAADVPLKTHSRLHF